MNTAEIKLDMFRRIDNLPKTDLDKIYNKFLALIDSTSNYNLSKAEQIAVNEALQESEKGNIYSPEDVKIEAKQKYPNLKFR